MERKQGDEQAWFTDKIRYGISGYVMLQLPHIELPPFSINDIPFDTKAELHCSLLSTERLATAYFEEPDTATEHLAAFVEAYVGAHNIEFEKFLPEAYLCKKDDIQSIVIAAQMSGVDELYSALRQQFSELSDLPDPALHVTLYKYNHQFGIGINSQAELDELCTSLPVNQLPKELQEQL